MSTLIPKRLLRRNRALQDLMELCRSVIADGDVSDEEARRILRWIDDHPHMNGVPPAHELVPVVRRTFEDGIVTEEEWDQLLALLERLVGTELDVQY